jgi:TonB family protein
VSLLLAALLVAGGHAAVHPPAPPPPPRPPNLWVPPPVLYVPEPPAPPIQPRDAVAVEQVAGWTIRDEAGRCSATAPYPSGRVLGLRLSPIEDRLTVTAARPGLTKADWNGLEPIAIGFSDGTRIPGANPRFVPSPDAPPAELSVDFDGQATLESIAESRSLALIAGDKVIELFPLRDVEEMADHLIRCAVQSRRTPAPTPFEPSEAARPAFSATVGPTRATANVAALMSVDDYPVVALRNGQQGIVNYHLHIGSDGLVRGCTVMSSSGFLALDAVTCQAIRERARFFPAQDSAGKPTDDSYYGRVRWVLPED